MPGEMEAPGEEAQAQKRGVGQRGPSTRRVPSKTKRRGSLTWNGRARSGAERGCELARCASRCGGGSLAGPPERERWSERQRRGGSSQRQARHRRSIGGNGAWAAPRAGEAVGSWSQESSPEAGGPAAPPFHVRLWVPRRVPETALHPSPQTRPPQRMPGTDTLESEPSAALRTEPWELITP